jgi:hypothetical protein
MDSLAAQAHRYAAPSASVGWLHHPRLEHLSNAVRGQRPEPLDEGSGVSRPFGRGRHYTTGR